MLHAETNYTFLDTKMKDHKINLDSLFVMVNAYQRDNIFRNTLNDFLDLILEDDLGDHKTKMIAHVIREACVQDTIRPTLEKILKWLEDETQIPYFAIDDKIVGLVKFLNAKGFKTIGSCQGGPGHAFSLPTVRIKKLSELENIVGISGTLTNMGVHGFSVKTVNMYQKEPYQPLPESYIEIELWNAEDLEKFNGENDVKST